MRERRSLASAAQASEIVGYYPDYPTALRAFLVERGYL
ncbi:hypothetical protein S7335_4924 [Synechococcus sp. PCC 7335]|nr:hypothetical protein S7335_4924 [Synechococcus sp. PCC 7335]